jgi:nucleoside-triphosphatase THEP1
MHNMPGKKIYILSGPVQSGKTTALMDWCEGKKNIEGILTPDIDGKRFFSVISSKEIFAMEAAPGEKNVLSAGRFTFSKKAFEKAILILQHSANKGDWLVIDEIGPLELRGEGFSAALNKILLANREDQKIILVVREGLVEKVVEYFQLSLHQVSIINKASQLRDAG